MSNVDFNVMNYFSQKPYPYFLFGGVELIVEN